MKIISKKSTLLLICTIFSIFQVKAQYTELTAGGTSPLDFPNSEFNVSSSVAGFPIDYDVDGDKDFIVIDTGHTTWHVIRNDGGGTFSEQTGVTLNLSITLSSSFFVFDFDGDGDEDILDPLKGAENQAAVFRNDGGFFTELTAGGTSPLDFPNSKFNSTTSSTSLPVDYDADGDDDIVVINNTLSGWHIIRNDGSGAFSEQTGVTLNLSLNTSYSFFVFDYDGDGDEDILDPLKGADNQAAVFRNDVGSFTELTAGGTSPLNFANSFFSVSPTPTSLPVDYDADGDDDIIVINNSTSGWHLIRNNGGASFSEETTTTIALSINGSFCFYTFDYDGDTDDDILDGLKGTNNQAAVFQNTNVPSLPVVLLGFNAIRQNENEVSLDWMTSSEINNSGFDIEKSQDGVVFEKIGFVKSHGNANKNQEYQFTLSNSESAYYRLKQIDFNGDFTYSELKFVGKNAINAEFAVYPNPIKNQLKFSFDSEMNEKSMKCNLEDLHGKQLFITSGTLLEIENKLNQRLQSLNNAIYILTIQTTNQVFIKKIILAK